MLLLYPDSLSGSQYDRIWQYVRRGGALLVVADPFVPGVGPGGGFDQLLGPTRMAIPRDVAISQTDHWRHARQLLAHPATVGMGQQGGQFSAHAGTPIHIAAPARPVIVGSWGWVDPSGDAAVSGTYQCEPGEQLGDLVLAAEQSVGRGVVFALGDGHGLTNEGIVGNYAWAGRLLGYLARRPSSPQAPWRQWATWAGCLGILVLVAWRLDARRLIAASLPLAITLAVCSVVNGYLGRVLPDGRLLASRADPVWGVAYIDASHVPAYNEAHWGFDAINGLALTLMRNGYLTLSLPETTSDRLQRADLLVSIAPARRFSRAERQAVRRFVEDGGRLICTVGAEQALGSRALLADFHLRVPASPVPTLGSEREPEPMGHFRSLFLNAADYGAGDHKVGVVFHAGWPVATTATDAEVLVRGRGDQPIVISRRVRKGCVVLIGDTGFAMNKNLEYIGGEPFDGGYENAHFWRWLITRVTDRPEWIPPPPVVEPNERSTAEP